MQEVFEHFACLYAEAHPAMVKIVDDYCVAKRENLVKQLEEKYTENLYDAIGEDNPFGD